MSSRGRYVERTIQDGEVTIFGRTFRPDERHMEYDGRLDGERYIFGLYPNGDADVVGGFETFAALWGRDEDHGEDGEWPGPECVDGVFPWYWWRCES